MLMSAPMATHRLLHKQLPSICIVYVYHIMLHRSGKEAKASLKLVRIETVSNEQTRALNSS